MSHFNGNIIPYQNKVKYNFRCKVVMEGACEKKTKNCAWYVGNFVA